MTSDHAADLGGTAGLGDHAADIDKHVRVYIIVFVALMALTLITVAISYLHLPTPMAIAVALLVATVKGSLVACYFMHLISEKKLIVRGPRADVRLLHRAAGPARPHCTATATGFTNEPQGGPRVTDPPFRGPRGAVRCLVPRPVRAGRRSRQPVRGRCGFRRVARPGRLRLVVPAQDEDAAMRLLGGMAARLLRRARCDSRRAV